MHSTAHELPDEFLVLSRQLGQAQQRCSATLAAQARQIELLQAQVVRLRAAVVVRDTRLAMAQEALAQLDAATPGLSRRKAMARHIGALAERVAAMSRECLRWRAAAQAPVAGAPAPHEAPSAPSGTTAAADSCEPEPATQLGAHFDARLDAASLVICQTGCLSHDAYWRVQDHCRRTGKPCILVNDTLAARQAQVLAAVAPVVVLRAAPPPADTEQAEVVVAIRV